MNELADSINFNNNEIPQRFYPEINSIIDNFQIQQILGEGTFGVVCKVQNLRNKQIYALKILKLWEIISEERKTIVQRFKGEYKCGQINNQNLVKTFAYGKKLGNPYIVMQYCPNGDIRKYIGKITDFKIIDKFAENVLSGLQALHNQGIIHRDLKPENILLDEKENALLTDFGIAGFQNSRMTKRNIFGHAKQVFGTFAYIPPEQLNQKISYKAMSTATDMFSFAASFYEIITGFLPFGELKKEGDLGEYVLRANNGRWTNPLSFRRDIPQKWINLIEKALLPDYNHRLQTVNQALHILNFKVEPEIDKFEPQLHKLALVIAQGEESGKVYEIEKMIPDNTGIITIGWFDENFPNKNKISIKDSLTAYISNYHATLEKSSAPPDWYIRDGQWREKNGKKSWVLSTNGVFVNSERINAAGKQIKNGDIITIGDSTLKVIKINDLK